MQIHSRIAVKLLLLLFSSPEPKAQLELLWSFDVRRSSCVVNNYFKGQRMVAFCPNVAGLVLRWPSLIIIQVIPVLCISMSHRLKYFRDENMKKNLLV